MLSMLFFLSIPIGFYSVKEDYNKMFSASREMADFIKANIPIDGKSVIILAVPWFGASVAYYLENYPVFDINGNPVKSLMIPSRFKNKNIIHSAKFNGMKIYYLIPKFLKEEMDARGKQTLLHSTPDSIAIVEDFCLYTQK